MADYFMQFCTIVHQLTKKERNWICEYLQPPSDEMLRDESEGAGDEILKWVKSKGNLYNTIDEEIEYWPHFEWKIQNAKPTNRSEWVLFSEEGANLDAVAHVLQVFLKKFRPDKYVTVEAGYTCSSNRSHGFGGTAMFITAKGVSFTSTMDWLGKKTRAFEKKEKQHA